MEVDVSLAAALAKTEKPNDLAKIIATSLGHPGGRIGNKRAKIQPHRPLWFHLQLSSIQLSSLQFSWLVRLNVTGWFAGGKIGRSESGHGGCRGGRQSASAFGSGRSDPAAIQ